MAQVNISESFKKQDSEKQQTENIKKEAADFDLAENGGFLTIVKYVVFSILGALNFRLFFAVIGGVWGVAIGCGSIFQEMFAIYCWNKQHKSTGKHRLALQFFSVAFTLISIVHALASIYELSGLGPSIGRPLYVYSHYVAAPLIFTFMIVGLFVLGFTHWSAAIAKARAAAQVKIEESRADLVTRTTTLEHRTQLDNAEIEHQENALKSKVKSIGLLEQYVAAEAKQQEIIDRIPNPQVRQRIHELLGVADAGHQPQTVAASDEKQPIGFNAPKSPNALSGSSLSVMNWLKSKQQDGGK